MPLQGTYLKWYIHPNYIQYILTYIVVYTLNIIQELSGIIFCHEGKYMFHSFQENST